VRVSWKIPVASCPLLPCDRCAGVTGAPGGDQNSPRTADTGIELFHPSTGRRQTPCVSAASGAPRCSPHRTGGDTGDPTGHVRSSNFLMSEESKSCKYSGYRPPPPSSGEDYLQVRRQGEIGKGERKRRNFEE
jgi:hypothetical protein